MRVLLTTVLLIIFPVLNYAQDIKVTKSAEVLKGMKYGFDIVIGGQSTENIYVYRSLEKSIELYKFNKSDLTLKEKKIISFKLSDDTGKKRIASFVQAKIPTLNKIMILKNNIIIFTNQYYKDEDKNSLFARSYDLNFEPVTGWEKIESIDAERSKNAGAFLITTSGDSSKILVAKIEPYEKKGREKLSFSVFNSALEKLVSTKEELEYKDKQAVISGHKITSDGTVYFILKIIEEKGYEFKIFKFDPNEEDELTQNNFDLELPEKRIIDIAFETNAEGDLLLAGFYSNTKFNMVNGIFSVWVMKDNEYDISNPVYSDITPSLGGKFDIDKLKIKSGYSFELIAEERYDVTRTTSSYNSSTKTWSTRTTTTYYENNVVYFQVDEDGNITKQYTVPKFSVSGAGFNPFLSYFNFTGSNSQIMFYNEHQKNFTESKRYRSIVGYNRSKKRVLAYSIFKGGETIQKILLKEKEEKFAFTPRRAVQISPTEVVMLAKRKRKYLLYKFTIGE